MNYQPIENYGVIGDLNTIALVSMEGSVDFMCFPRFDSPSIFAALLDRERGGNFEIAPAAGTFKSRQRYLPDTNILLTRFLGSKLQRISASTLTIFFLWKCRYVFVEKCEKRLTNQD